MTDFFISRNKADRDWAEWIAWQLEKAGYSTIVQDWDFGAGANFALEMHRGTQADRTIAVLSPDFLASEYTAPEWAAAFAQDPTGAKRKLLPVRVRECKPQGLLGQIVYVDLVGVGEATARAKLLAAAEQGRAKPTTAPPFPGHATGPKPAFPGTHESAATTADVEGSAAVVLDAAAAATHIDRHAWGVRPERGRGGWTGDVWLGTVAVPERQAIPYLDDLDLGTSDFQDRLTSLALHGQSAVFRPSRMTEAREAMDHLALHQREERQGRPVAVLEAHTDGTLVYRAAVERRAPTANASLVDSLVIDEDAVRRQLTAFVAFAAAYYSQLGRDPGSLYLGASLSDIERKHFGRLPRYEVTSFTVGDPRIDDPLRVPATPLKVSQPQLADPGAVAARLVAHVARIFRIAGAYYAPNQ